MIKEVLEEKAGSQGNTKDGVMDVATMERTRLTHRSSWLSNWMTSGH